MHSCGELMTKFYHKLLDLIFPKGLTCIVCEDELTDGEREFAVCTKCAFTMQKIENSGADIGVMSYACFSYEGAVKNIVVGYKDGDKPYMAEYMAKYMERSYRENALECEVITYVPTAPDKLRRRGYDAMKYAGRHLSKYLSKPLFVMEKKKGGKDLTLVDAANRAEEVKDKFFVTDGDSIKGKRVLLLDDVITTGATVKECAKTLYAAGVKEVVVLAFSRTV